MGEGQENKQAAQSPRHPLMPPLSHLGSAGPSSCWERVLTSGLAKLCRCPCVAGAFPAAQVGCKESLHCGKAGSRGQHRAWQLPCAFQKSGTCLPGLVVGQTAECLDGNTQSLLITSGCPQIRTRLGRSWLLICCSPASSATTAERKANGRWDERSQAFILIRKTKKEKTTLCRCVSRAVEALGPAAWGGDRVCSRGDLWKKVEQPWRKAWVG